MLLKVGVVSKGKKRSSNELQCVIFNGKYNREIRSFGKGIRKTGRVSGTRSRRMSFGGR